MRTLIGIELLKVFTKWRTYIGFLAIGILVPVVQAAVYFEGTQYIAFTLQSLRQQFVFTGEILNGYFVANLLIRSLFIHIPFLIVLVGGDLLAGEATAGTFRILLTRPVSRSQVVAAKFTAGFIYTFALIFWLALLGLVLSLIIFGTGDLVVIGPKIYVFSADDVLWRFIGAYLFGVLSMTTVMALAFFFSSFVENAIGPIVGAMAVIIIFMIVSALPVSFLQDLRPFLFTNYLSNWIDFLKEPMQFTVIVKSATVLAAHILLFYLLTLFNFTRKDILS